jgi:multisubunit Na+/H+ antiporter MnhE subunit
MSSIKSKVLKSFGVHFMLLSCVWLLLTDSNSSAFGFGFIFVLLATIASYLLRATNKQQTSNKSSWPIPPLKLRNYLNSLHIFYGNPLKEA